MYGWMGTILRVDLCSGKIAEEPLSEELTRNYLGGRGINARILYDEVKPGTDGLAPENVLIFGTGPLTGTAIAAGRLNITAMSPLTNIFGDSNAGSHFSSELKYSGYDHIIFTGKADAPVYLWIEDGKAELRDARHLWGKMTDVTQQTIREELGDPCIQVACIGPAGERLVRLSGIAVGTHGFCARCGLGAVMGSKNLKAVAVRGTRGVKVYDSEPLRDYLLDLMRTMMQNPVYSRLSVHGSSSLYGGRHLRGILTLKNGQETGSFWGYDNIKCETLREEYIVKDHACCGCAMHCRQWYDIKEGPYAGLKGIGMELSQQQAWGSMNDNAYAPSLYKGLDLCNKYGLDSLECGQLLAAATEWYQKGLITKEDTQGIELDWGNYEAMVAMVHKIANREGIGDLLAEDAVRAAHTLGRGADQCITQCKGALKTNNDLRADPVYAFGHAVATRGCDHLRGALPVGIPVGQYEGVAEKVFENTYVCTIADATEMCKFITAFVGLDTALPQMADLIGLVTGMRLSEQELREIADRIWALERSFGVREGVTRKDDFLVGRSMDQPIHGGPLDGFAYDREKWGEMLDRYYELVGWDKDTGVPTRETLERLGLAGIADELEAMGKL